MTTLMLVTAIAGAIVTVAGAAAISWRAFVAGVEQAVGSRLDSLEQKMSEQDEDIAAHHGMVLAHLARLEDCLDSVHKQVFPNGGSSLRDKVDDLYELVLRS